MDSMHIGTQALFVGVFRSSAVALPQWGASMVARLLKINKAPGRKCIVVTGKLWFRDLKSWYLATALMKGTSHLLRGICIFFIVFAMKMVYDADMALKGCSTPKFFVKLRLNHWWQMDYFDNVFHTFLGLDSVNCLAVNGTVTSFPVFIQNILNCVLKTNKAFTDLEPHGSKWLMTKFSFWGGVTL